jgi:hypothetical protein
MTSFPWGTEPLLNRLINAIITGEGFNDPEQLYAATLLERVVLHSAPFLCDAEPGEIRAFPALVAAYRQLCETAPDLQGEPAMPVTGDVFTVSLLTAALADVDGDTPVVVQAGAGELLWISEATLSAMHEFHRVDEATIMLPAEYVILTAEPKRPRRRNRITADFLRQVAGIYRANFDAAPTQAVARAFRVKQRMAHEYVRRARERGFLPPTTTPGKKRA